MIVNMEYNGVSNTDKGFYLKEYPSFTFFNRQYNSTTINGRRGALITDLKSYDNLKISVKFLILNDYTKSIREIKHWLKGTGKLIFSDDETIFYDVLKVTYGNNDREYYDRGTFEVEFTCYPFEFKTDGETALGITDASITNPYDESYPIYEMPAGSGILTVNSHAFEYKDCTEPFLIDTRRKMVISQKTNSNYCNKTKGDFENLRLLSGKNMISGVGTIKVYPYWGYNI